MMFVGVINKKDVNEQPSSPIRGTDLCEVVMTIGQNGPRMITNQDLVRLKGTDEEAFELAEARTAKEKFVARTLQETLGLDLRNSGFTEDFSDEAALTFDSVRDVYVLTNESNSYGSSVLTRQDILRDLYSKIGSFYILPASRHEVLAISTEWDISIDDLKAMVKIVNTTEVRPEDWLSDEVFVFDGRTFSMDADNKKTVTNNQSEYEGRGIL